MRAVFRRIASVALAALLLVPAPAFAYHRDRQQELERLMDQKREQIRRAQAAERSLEERIADSDARRATIQARLDAIEDDLAVARARLERVEERLDGVTAELRVKTRELEQTLGRLQVQTTLFNDRVAEMYISAPAGLLTMLKASENFEDFAAATEYMTAVTDADMSMLEELERTKALVESQRRVIETRRAELQADRKAAKEEADRIARIRATQAAARDELAGEVSYKRSLLTQVRDRKAAYQRALRSYEAESQSISSFLRGTQSGQTVIQGRGGWLKYPVSGRISSGYGWRTHPIYGYRSFHSGIDIAAPSGTTVKASRHGGVVFVGYKGAYGLVVILDHGNSVATLYAHLSRTYVRVGERVGTLEPIAAVGSTGWSTGPHLHFEVRVNGEPQDPMRWL